MYQFESSIDTSQIFAAAKYKCKLRQAIQITNAFNMPIMVRKVHADVNQVKKIHRAEEMGDQESKYTIHNNNKVTFMFYN